MSICACCGSRRCDRWGFIKLHGRVFVVCGKCFREDTQRLTKWVESKKRGL